MPVLETLVITIGYAVAKGLFNYWLKEDPVADAVGGDLIDLVKDKTKDILAAKKGARFFDEIGDKVAVRLEPLFKSYQQQPASLKEKQVEIEAVAREVATAIEKSKLSARLLTSLNNEPRRLYKHIQAAHPMGAKNFSEREISLYERALDLCAQYVVDLASALPEYSTTNFTEVLNRLDQSSEKLEKILEELDSLAEVSAGQKSQFADFERDYRAALVRKLDRINLFGARIGRSTKRYKLSVAYVSLDVVIEDDDSDHEIDDAKRAVEDALSTSKRCVIVGEAGSGKTTLLQWLAVKSAANTFGRRMVDWRDTIPFFIELRKFTSDFPSPEEFVEKGFPEISGQMPKRWIEEQLRNGRALILIDGLDEVKSNMREKVYQGVEALINAYPDIRVVLTSRPTSLEFEPYREMEFSEFRLAPMDFAEIARFIFYWHNAVLIEPGLETKERAKIITEKLENDIRFSTPLSRLATNPLLCAMICALNYEGDMTLPSERIALYEACCNMLLEWRDIEKEVHQDQFPSLKYAQKRAFIDDLAYWMMKNGLTTVTSKQLKERITLKIPNMQFAVAEIDASTIKALLIERSGMLREPARDSIDFVHRTFQEYMAASAAHAENDWGLLVKNSVDPLWRETIILAAGLANKQSADHLISELIRKADSSHRDNNTRSYLELLAISCLETAVEISATVRSEVETRLRKILPPRSRAQIESLVAAKELAVKHLDAKLEYNDAENIACIQVLGRIATIPAIKKLGGYTISHRAKVVGALDSILGQLTPEDISYAGLSSNLLDYLSSIAKGQNIRLSGNLMLALSKEPPDRIRSAMAPLVKSATIYNSPPSCELIPQWFPELEELRLMGRFLPEDLHVLASLKKLERIELKNESALWPEFRTGRFHHLHTLTVDSSSEEWPDLEVLDFPRLHSLCIRVADTDDLPEELEIATQFDGLQQLRICMKEGSVPDLSPLRRIEHLEILEIGARATNFPGAIFGIEDLDNLKKLRIIVDQITMGLTYLVEQVKEGLPYCQIEVERNSLYYRL